jgi:polyisoprenoid-binding protein YceI
MSAPLAAEASHVPTAQTVDADAETYALDASTMTVEADVQAMTVDTLHFKATGQLVISPRNLLATTLDLTIDVTSANAAVGVVADIGKSNKFLDAVTYPTARFSSRALTQTADSATEIFGQVMMHGTTKTIRVPVTVTVDSCKVDVATSFAFNRHDYHIDSDGSIDGLVGNSVVLRIDAHPPRQSRSPRCASPDPRHAN